VPPSVLPNRECVTDGIQRQPSIFRDTWGDGAGVLFGRLDNEPVVGMGLRLSGEITVSYGKVVKHRKAFGFERQ
jgi:hypothetical protein